MKQKWESRYCSFWVNSPCYIYYIIKGRIFYNFMRLLITSAPKQKKKLSRYFLSAYGTKKRSEEYLVIILAVERKL